MGPADAAAAVAAADAADVVAALRGAKSGRIVTTQEQL